MLRRLVPATAAAGLLLAGLTGCSAQLASAADCSPALQPGVLSDGVTVLGGFGEVPEVSIPEDVSIDATQRTIVAGADAAEEASEDDARVAVDQSLVGVNMAFFDSSTSEQVYESPGFGDAAASPELLLLDDETANPLSEAVRCTVPGDRVVLAFGPDDSAAFGAQLGTTGDAAIVGVLDVVSTAALAADGPVRGLPNGYPAVVTNDEGRPGMVLPPSEAPTATSSAVRIAGDGEKVAADDGVVAQVLQVSWDGSVKLNTWDTGLTALGTEDQIAQSGYTFRSELTGKQIGSQVVVVEALDGGDAQVVVVDIVGVS
ncbi:peptidylprolyl isomerase [Leucobacter allii]|uniref:Peptidylprolyl isomerase n=1 Tax=Leucobacter allii TaxID=2932247 RepID=A0ABY4FQ83_9MICO|nr:peptidylprolyl isomerase [Leucobacter allii]UOQ58445.1 peptidylprolyl isomerase [Leucobacter allii]